MRFEGLPMADQVSPNFRNKVMHATFAAPLQYWDKFVARSAVN